MKVAMSVIIFLGIFILSSPVLASEGSWLHEGSPLNTEGWHSGPIDPFDMNAAMKAAAQGDLAGLVKAVTLGVDLKSTNSNGASLLYFAAQSSQNSIPIFEYVRKHLGDSEFQNLLMKTLRPNGHSVAMEAVFNTNADLVDYLVELKKSGLNVNFESPTVFGWTPRTFAEREKMPFAHRIPPGKIEADQRIEWMQQQEAQWLSSLDETAYRFHQRGKELISAIEKFDLKKIDQLIESGVEVNQRYGRLGATPLNSSVRPGMTPSELVQAQTVQTRLLELGANPNYSEGGIMMVASGFRESVFGYADLIDQMLTHLEAAPIERQKYLNFQGPLNAYSKLIDAALRGKADVIRILVRAGANKSLQGHNGLTAFEAAKLYNHQSATPLASEILEMLKP